MLMNELQLLLGSQRMLVIFSSLSILDVLALSLAPLLLSWLPGGVTQTLLLDSFFQARAAALAYLLSQWSK